MEGNVGFRGAVVARDETSPVFVGGGERLVLDFGVQCTELELHVDNGAGAGGAAVGGFHVVVVAFVVD